MPLILRSDLNRRLTEQELDGNFTYLESISGTGGGGTQGPQGPQGPAGGGTGSGATGPQGPQGPAGGGSGMTGSPNQILFFGEGSGEITSTSDLLKYPNGFLAKEFLNGDEATLIIGSASRAIPNGAILAYANGGYIGTATWSVAGVVPGSLFGVTGPAAMIGHVPPLSPPTNYIAVHGEGIDINGTIYQFPAGNSSGSLTNNGSGDLTWSSGGSSILLRATASLTNEEIQGTIDTFGTQGPIQILDSPGPGNYIDLVSVAVISDITTTIGTSRYPSATIGMTGPQGFTGHSVSSTAFQKSVISKGSANDMVISENSAIYFMLQNNIETEQELVTLGMGFTQSEIITGMSSGATTSLARVEINGPGPFGISYVCYSDDTSFYGSFMPGEIVTGSIFGSTASYPSVDPPFNGSFDIRLTYAIESI